MADIGKLNYDWYNDTLYQLYRRQQEELQRQMFSIPKINLDWFSTYAIPTKKETEVSVKTETKTVYKTPATHFDDKNYTAIAITPEANFTYVIQHGDAVLKVPSREALKQLHALVQHLLLEGK